MNIRILSDGSERAARQRGIVRATIVILVIAMILIQLGGFLFTRQQQQAYLDIRTSARSVRIAQLALADADDGVMAYALTREDGHLRRYYFAMEGLRAQQPVAAAALGKETAKNAFGSLPQVWLRAIAAIQQGSTQSASALLSRDAARLQVSTRSAMERYLTQLDRKALVIEERLNLGHQVVLWMQLGGGLLTILALILAFRSSSAEFRARRKAAQDAVAARDQAQKLFQMTDMLQSASDHVDANAVFRTTAKSLMPDLACALYIFNNSGDRLELSSSWGFPEGRKPAEALAPRNCWAIKRGKTHLNLPDNATLACPHHESGSALEIPMMAMGEIYGLLIVAVPAESAVERLESVRGIATALAEGMSLALSNIALREKLRNQALRDPLTGLYNRRYMEDMLQRFAHLASRNDTPLSVVMIDLDHFKRINDEHGHSAGDNVLREAAAIIEAGIRQSDVACRYGGEEIILLLTDSTLQDSVSKANALRLRIEELSERFGFRITASFGVAAIPDNSQSVTELVTQADGALYQAKQAGRNRVVAAERRAIAAEAMAAE